MELPITVYEGPESDHFDGRHFRNPGAVDHSVKDVLRWMRTRKKAAWPVWVEERPQPVPPRKVDAGELRVTVVNHSTVLIQLSGLNILTDPIWSKRCSPVPGLGPKRVRRPAVAFDALPDIDLVLLSHNHYDHMDLPTLRRLRKHFRAPILTGLGNSAYLASRGVSGARDLDWWECTEWETGLKVTLVPAHHFSARGLGDRNRTLWGGFVLERAGRSVYFAGDTGYGPHFGEIGRRFPDLDVSLLPIGAYEPQWFMGPVHLNPEEAIRAHLDLGTRYSVAIHFGTFQLTDEAFDAPVEALKEGLVQKGVDSSEFLVMAFGEGRAFERRRAMQELVE